MPPIKFNEEGSSVSCQLPNFWITKVTVLIWF